MSEKLKLMINKFKIDDCFIAIKYERDSIKTEKEFTRSKENITEELSKAIDELKYHLLDCCVSEFISNKDEMGYKLIEDWQLARTTIYGITFTYYDNCLKGAVISGGYKLLHSTGVINMNTPHRINSHYNEMGSGDDGQLMSTFMWDAVKKVHAHIEDYLNGNRVKKQPDLEGISDNPAIEITTSVSDAKIVTDVKRLKQLNKELAETKSLKVATELYKEATEIMSEV